MNESDCIVKRTPDDIANRVIKKKLSLHNARKRISEKYDKKESTNLKLNLRLNEVIVDTTKRKRNASKEFKNFENNVQMFNQLYKEYGEFISNFFENDMNDLFKNAELVLNYFNDISKDGADISCESYNNLSLIQLAIEFIVNGFQMLKNNAEEEHRTYMEKQILEKQLQEELRRSEYTSVICPKYRNNIRKQINHICSQITTDNPTHALGRLRDLISLLNEEDVTLVGSEGRAVINLKSHPRARDICWEFLRQAVVTQTQSQFCVNVETAIVFASLLVAVLGRFPDELTNMLKALEARFSELLSSSLPDECDHDDDGHLNSLKGIARLVAAISVAHPPPGFVSHPDLGPAFLWSLLARICHQEIVSSFSAQACVSLLEIGGNALWKIYGNQFEKLLIAVKKKFGVSSNLTERLLLITISNALEKKSFEYLGYLPDEKWPRC